MRDTIGASVQQFPFADLKTPRVSASASASATDSLHTAPEADLSPSDSLRVRVERVLYRWLCMTSATTEADVELQRASLQLPDGYRFPGPRGWDTRFPNLRDLLLDIHEDFQFDFRTRERLVFGISPKWTLIKQMILPFLGWKFDLASLSTSFLFSRESTNEIVKHEN